MRKIFQKWLFVFVMAAFFLTFAVSFLVQTKYSESNAQTLISVKIDDVKKQLILNERNLKDIREDSDKTALDKAKSVAAMLKLNPLMTDDIQMLTDVAQIVGVDEINIIDEKGIIRSSTEKKFVGYDMAGSKQSAFFMPILTDKSLTLVQDPQPIGYDGSYAMQYAAVARQDADGFIEIGYRPERLYDALRVADIKNLAAGFRVGNEGNVMIVRDGKIISFGENEWLDKDVGAFGFTADEIAKSGAFFKKALKDGSVFVLVEHFGDYVILGMLPSQEIYISRNTMAYMLIFCNLIVFTIIFVLISLLVQRVVINGIYNVNKSLEKITDGNLEEQVKVDSNEEFQSLSSGINATVTALKKAIAEAASRIDAELGFARDIQSSSLPCVFPPFPDRKEIDIYAMMHTAKEVGGDFYDFFFIDATHLAVIIADVSGKGIPAALFMMTAKAQIKNTALTGMAPKDVFTQANNHLCENNDTGMFVTAFLGVLDTQTGELTLVNGGHNPALIRRKNGDFSYLTVKPGFILGGLPDFPYKQETVQMNDGDTLFLYTDGVTEAMDVNQKLYSNDRLAQTLNATDKNASAKELVDTVLQSVKDYAQGAEQADDITMLAVTFYKK